MVPRWLRLGIAVSFFLLAALELRKGLWGESVPLACLGLMFLLDVGRRSGETLGTYFKRPQAYVGFVLGVPVLVWSVRGLYELALR